MRMSLLCVALMALAQTAPALAQPLSGAPAPAPDKAISAAASAGQSTAAMHSDTEALVCHSITSTGTRFEHRECHTAFEWRQMGKDASDYAKYVQQRANSFCVGPC